MAGPYCDKCRNFFDQCVCGGPCNTLLSDILAGRRMASHHFSLQLHCSRQGDTPVDLWDFEKRRPQLGWKYVGWCPAASTVIPVSGWGTDYPIAVMVENTREEQVWCHVPATPDLVSAGFSWGPK